jgi:predicted AAA+ superfamily ATPase
MTFARASIDIDIYHTETKSKIINLFERFLLGGGFPELLVMDDEQLKLRVLQGYFDVMIYRDMVERFNISNVGVLRYFLKRVLENVTSPTSVNKIYNELKSQGYRIGKNLLYEYLQYAEDVYLFSIVKKYERSLIKQELGEKKVYAIDNGLLNAVTSKFSKDKGKLLENAVFMELRKKGRPVSFFKNRKECDFIIMDNQEKVAIQVTYSISDAETLKRETEGIIEACKTSGIRDAVILTSSEENILNREGIEIKILPTYKWLLMDL